MSMLFRWLLLLIVLASKMQAEMGLAFRTVGMTWRVLRLRCVNDCDTYASPMVDSGVLSQQQQQLLFHSNDRIQGLVNNTLRIKENIDAMRLLIADENALQRSLDEQFGEDISRLNNELQRIRDRAMEQRNEIVVNAQIKALQTLLPMLDNFDRAQCVCLPCLTPRESSLWQEFAEAFSALHKIFSNMKVEKISAMGQPFDVNCMEAIAVKESAYPRDTVCDEYQSGYKLGSKVLRPAIVAVSGS